MARVRPDTEDYRALFLADAPLLDTRAPVEFLRGAFPQAQNLPLMTDDERAAVGTCYKERGQAAAIELGHQLVSGAIREERIDRWRAFSGEHPEGYLYCFRGGLRSQLVQEWLADAGIHYPRVLGGYKAMRRFLLDTLERLCASSEFVLVAGATGTGKTRLIQRLPRAIDLEGIAHHRGSAFGRFLEPQPSQIDFENALAIALLKLESGGAPIFLEDEGKLIGRVALPDVLRRRMAEAPMLLLEYSLEERVEVVLEDYILDLGARFRQAFGDDGPAHHRERMLGDLQRTRKRLGGERYRDVLAMMENAFAAPSDLALPLHRQWISRLLSDYYDPMYRYQLSQRAGERLRTGNRDSLAAYVEGLLAGAD